MVHQGVTTGQQQAIEIGLVQHIEAHLHIVDAKPDMAQQAFVPHAAQLRQGLVDDLAQHPRIVRAMRAGVAVVHIDHVQRRHAQPLQAVLDAAAHAARRIVPALRERQYVDITVLRTRRRRTGPQQTPHLGGQREGCAIAAPQRLPEPMLAQSIAVVRCGVETAAPRAPCCVQQRLGRVVADGGKQVSQRRATQTQPQSSGHVGEHHGVSC